MQQGDACAVAFCGVYFTERVGAGSGKNQSGERSLIDSSDGLCLGSRLLMISGSWLSATPSIGAAEFSIGKVRPDL